MADSMGFHMVDINGAREAILPHLKREYKVIYFDGWNGLGATPVLTSVSQVLTSKEDLLPGLNFDRMVCVDCSVWESRREMQRRIAKELKLDPKTMAIFDEKDEDDDFNGKDHRSRDLILSVSTAIDQTLGYRRFFMVFFNGSDDEIDVSKFGINPEYRDHRILWTFKKKRIMTLHSPGSELKFMLRYTDYFISGAARIGGVSYSEFRALLREEAASMDACTNCCLYDLFLYHSFHKTTGFDRVAHASLCWLCGEIVQGDRQREVSNALIHPEVSGDCNASLLDGMFEKFKEDPESPFLVVKDDGIFEMRPYRWISITTSKNLEMLPEGMQTILESAWSLFIAFEKSSNPPELPYGLLKHCSNLGVLILSCCAVSFASPPFRHCHTIRFLALDHCTDACTSEGEDCMGWTCLHSLLVLDIRYTDWDDILSEEKMDLMANLRELNMEGIRCWQHIISQLQGRLPNIQRLRIIKPMQHAESSTNISGSFLGKAKLEILDLSGSSDMESLPASLSKASNLQVLVLDGCDGLVKVAVPDKLPSSLRSFSFDGYGPASHWTSTVELSPESSRPKPPSDANKKHVKTTEISLHGCTQLENLFIRGLLYLVELDLSGSPIKILDFVTMMVDVPMLKRLFLLGCEHLRAIGWDPVKWERGSRFSVHQMELICIDTRARKTVGCTRPPLAQHKPFKLQVHAILTDARIGRTLCPPGRTQLGHLDDVYYSIHVVSSNVRGGFVQVKETGREEMIGRPSNQHRHLVLAAGMYRDVFTEVGAALILMTAAFPLPPSAQLDRHLQIGDGRIGGDHELDAYGPDNLGHLMEVAQSLHMHDVWTRASMRAQHWYCLKWCRIERCSNMETVFTPAGKSSFLHLETMWASHLSKTYSIWGKGFFGYKSKSFQNLQHLHLSSCPRLQFVLPLWQASLPILETLHIIHCGELRHVFTLDDNRIRTGKKAIHVVQLSKLTTIHLHDLPNLRRICEVKMQAPVLETIRIRGCFGLRRLPALQSREPSVKRPAVEMEKDVWDALEWDGLAASHHPDLYEPPVHSRYYRRSRRLRGTVLR